MANVAVGGFLPSGGGGFAIPQIGLYDAVLYSLIALLVALILGFLYRFFVYKIRILELQDRGRGSLKATVLLAREVMKNGRPRYQIWGKKDPNDKGFFRKPLMINASPSDNLIPIKQFGLYKDLVIMHKDKVGDYRPWQVITNKEQIDLNQYFIGEGDKKMFNVDAFLEDTFPVIKPDNLKMRGWYHLNVKETLNMYKESGLSPEVRNMMILLFVVFALCVGAYMLLK